MSLLLWLCVAAFAVGGEAACLRATYLRVESLQGPLGVQNLQPRLSWLPVLESGLPSDRNVTVTAARVVVSSTADGVGDVWDSGRVSSSHANMLEYGGPATPALSRRWFRVEVWGDGMESCGLSEAGVWGAGPPSGWLGAAWVRSPTPVPSDCAMYSATHPNPVLFHAFKLPKAVARATLHVSGLGFSRVLVNARQVADVEFGPFTSYADSIMFSSFDVPPSALASVNNITVELGNGWFNPAPLRLFGRFDLRERLTAVGAPQAIALLHVVYTDNSTQAVVTSPDWLVGSSDRLFNNIYLGEVVDHGLLTPSDWNWQPSTTHAVAGNSSLGDLVPASVPPARRKATFAASLTTLADGRVVADMGVNFAGFVNVSVRGPPGAQLHALYGELLFPNGTVNGLTSVAGQVKSGDGGPCAPTVAYQRDMFILKGGDGEQFVNRFTWHGFRYVEFVWGNGTGTVEAASGIQVFTDVPRVSAFSTSSSLLNTIYDAHLRSQQSNLVNSGIQSDCPHRERLGYGGDAAATAEAMAINFDMAAFDAKRVLDFEADVEPNGGFTEVAPDIGISSNGLGDGAGPVGWGLVQPMFLNLLDVYYNTSRPASLPFLYRWVNLLTNHSVDGLLSGGLGDWSAYEPRCTRSTSSGFYWLSALTAAQLGDATARPTFAKLADSVASAFNSAFLNASTGVYEVCPSPSGTLSQSQQSMPLAFGMVPPSSLDLAIAALHSSAASNAGNFVGGMYSTKWWLLAQSFTGAHDAAVGAMLKTDVPSWGYQIQSNATTIWEAWEFSNNTYSHNHAMWSSFCEWGLKAVVGVSIGAQPSVWEALNSSRIWLPVVGSSYALAKSWRRALFWPQPLPGVLTAASGHLNTLQGTYASSWALDASGTGFVLNVSVPVGGAADVMLPKLPRGRVHFLEGGLPVAGHPHVRDFGPPPPNAVGTAGVAQIVSIGSGNYSFSVSK